MSQWQSLCLALVVSFAPASAAFAQALASGHEIQSGDVWLLPGDQTYPSPIAALPLESPSNGYVPTGDVWLSPDRQAVPSNTAQELHPGNAALANRK